MDHSQRGGARFLPRLEVGGPRALFFMGNAPGQRITLGIDPGMAIVGYAVVAARGDDLDMIACDVITTPVGMPLAQRLQHIYRCLGEVITSYHPNEAAMEELFFAKNARTALTVGQARGVAMLALANGGLSVAEYTPLQVKQAVTGYGSAKKEQVGEMVRILLHLPSVPRPDDAADAAAVAICHLHTARYTQEQRYPSDQRNTLHSYLITE